MMKAIKKLTKRKSTVSGAKKKSATKVAKKTKAVKAPSKRKKTTAKISSSDFLSMVEKTAYELYEKRGYSHGKDMGDWFEAEKIVKAKLSKK